MADLHPVPDAFEFHHLGYATKSIDRDRALFERLGYQLEGHPFSDPIQGVHGCFMVGPGPRIELLENLPGSITLSPWLEAGVKMYHMAYWVSALQDAVQWAQGQGARVVGAAAPAVAFGERRICFVMFRTGQMIEFLERKSRI